MPSPNKTVFFDDLKLKVPPDVYEPAEDSFLFAENLRAFANAHVLDMGTGSGILALLAAKQASKVVALDINPHAIRVAKQNAKQNGLDSTIFFVEGDLFAPFQNSVRFDLIMFNAPYLPSEQGEDAFWLGRAWAGGLTGREVIDRFITQVPLHLGKQGSALLMQSNLAGVEATVELAKAVGLKAKIVAHQDLPFFETLELLLLTAQ